MEISTLSANLASKFVNARKLKPIHTDRDAFEVAAASCEKRGGDLFLSVPEDALRSPSAAEFLIKLANEVGRTGGRVIFDPEARRTPATGWLPEGEEEIV